MQYPLSSRVNRIPQDWKLHSCKILFSVTQELHLRIIQYSKYILNNATCINETAITQDSITNYNSVSIIKQEIQSKIAHSFYNLFYNLYYLEPLAKSYSQPRVTACWSTQCCTALITPTTKPRESPSTTTTLNYQPTSAYIYNKYEPKPSIQPVLEQRNSGKDPTIKERPWVCHSTQAWLQHQRHSTNYTHKRNHRWRRKRIQADDTPPSSTREYNSLPNAWFFSRVQRRLRDHGMEHRRTQVWEY